MATYSSEKGNLEIILKDDPTQAEVERFEVASNEIIGKQRLDAVAFGAYLVGAFRGGWVDRVKGGPGSEAEIQQASARVVIQLGRWVYLHYLKIKEPDPNW
jgi:hypothetical protein